MADAHEIADTVLFPAAMAVDGADRLPPGHLDLLAAEGLYGLRLDDLRTAAGVIETLAGGCLATTFVWLQHLGPLMYATHSEQPGVRETWAGPMSRGEVRAGIAVAGLAPGADLRVRGDGDGFRITGAVPWVTGWDMIDVVHVGVRDDRDVIHHLLVDARTGPTLQADRQHLVAVQASRTVSLRFDDHPVPSDRLVATQPYAAWAESNASGGVINGFLALGLAGRCARLTGPGPLDAQLDECRSRLLAGTDVPAARAATAELAYRAAGALAVHTGSRAVLLGDTAQRLAREAAFLLVFGSRPAIKKRLYARLVAQ
jgi:alkylation response protein AidB-like acyl-CoA dehydrogenase